MNNIQEILNIGETIAVEFKKCENGISADIYKTVCSFLNRYGGDIYLGIADDKTIIGIPQKSIPALIKNIISSLNNPEIISPTVYISPEILEFKGKKLLKIHVPSSSEVHSYKKAIYDRNDEADVKVTSTNQIASLYIRKQNIYTEKKVYPYIKSGDLNLKNLPHIRQMAINRNVNHPWKELNDTELLRSAGLYGEDKESGQKGYNLAAVMLFGKDNLINSIVPAYRTDALLRKVNLDRYDDRLIVSTNLLDSYELLMDFARKHLWDKFYLEGDVRIGLRDAIIREMLVNTLIHREFTSSFFARFVIEKHQMFTENANRAVKDGPINPSDFNPNPKNPTIASFFRNIGLADELGSGVRNLFYYVKRYSGKNPQLIEGDIFKIIVPLDDSYSFSIENEKTDFISDKLPSQYKVGDKVGDKVGEKLTSNQHQILLLIKENPYITAVKLSEEIGISSRKIEENLKKLKSKAFLERIGSDNGGYWNIL